MTHIYFVQPTAELLSLQQLRCFSAALELGSFTAAAGALGVSQPPVAEQVRRLEQALGADPSCSCRSTTTGSTCAPSLATRCCT